MNDHDYPRIDMELSGRVQSMTAAVSVGGEDRPLFVFTLLAGNSHETFHVDLGAPGADAIATVVAAAYAAGVAVDLRLRPGNPPRRVEWVQVSKPPEAMRQPPAPSPAGLRPDELDASNDA